jgi:hypothetical protein
MTSPIHDSKKRERLLGDQHRQIFSLRERRRFLLASEHPPIRYFRPQTAEMCSK